MWYNMAQTIADISDAMIASCDQSFSRGLPDLLSSGIVKAEIPPTAALATTISTYLLW